MAGSTFFLCHLIILPFCCTAEPQALENFMKHLNIFKRALLALLILCSSSVWAYEFEVDGIYYNITDETSRTVEVTYGENKYTGNVIIPSTVTYNSVAYSVTGIGSYAFNYCTSLTSITIPNSVTSIGNNAFSHSDGLTEITIPNSVTYIGSYAFEYCDGLTEITIPNSVTYIEKRAFMYCTGLTSVTIPNSVTSIGGRAFQECTSLTSITIPNSVTSIDNTAFRYCYSLTSIVVDEENSVYDSREGCNAIIETATNTLVIGCKNTTIPNSVTSIGYQAFSGCDGLTEITIPNGVTSIGYSAFGFCTGLTGITIGNSVTSIGYYAFQGCNSLTSIEIPNSVTSIGVGAFNECFGLANIVIDENNNVYDSREGCNAIIETATNTLIAGCKNTTIPGSVTSIGERAFYGCTGLTSIEIPNGVTSIGESAFRGCSGLTSVTIPNSVTSIGDDAFGFCTGLTGIAIGNSVTTIGDYAFVGCEGITSVTIPNSVTNIGVYAFWGCSGLTSVTIGNCVTTIGYLAFYGCSGLTSVTIGNSVTEIGWEAFYNCSNLTDIYFASNPTIGDDAIPSTATRHLTITDSDAADFNTANANTYTDVSYTRTISEGKYGTIMLPFAPDEASLQNYAFYTLKEAGDGYIRFEEVAAPEANTPYLYTLRAGAENTAITGGETTIAADIANGTVGSWDLVGSFTNQTIDCTTGNYYAYSAARNEINRITKTLTVSPYRAYLKSTAAQNSNLRVFIGGTTGVTEISPDDIEGFDGGAVYDLYGRPVSEPAKGDVYIIDGKKVVW